MKIILGEELKTNISLDEQQLTKSKSEMGRDMKKYGIHLKERDIINLLMDHKKNMPVMIYKILENQLNEEL